MKKSCRYFLMCLVIIAASLPTQLVVQAAPVPASYYTYRGTDYSAVYDYEYYKSHNPDLVQVYKENPAKYIEHFAVIGMKEGRQAIEGFDVLSYRRAYGDLRRQFGKDLKKYYTHYMLAGRAEGRDKTTNVSVIADPIESYGDIDLKPIYSFREYLAWNDDMRELYSDDDLGALEHYLRLGIFEGRIAKTSPDPEYIARVRKVAGLYGNEINTYRGIDLSPIYDCAYYLWSNPDIAESVDYDPKSALDHFILNGMDEGRKGRATWDQSIYDKLKEEIRNSNTLESKMADVANRYTSPTNYIILVDKSSMRVAVFNGSKGNYALANSFDCAIGANSSPTPSGVYHVGARGLYFNTGTAGRCWYYTQIRGNYLFHSQIYDRSPSPVRLIDASMSKAVSHGCIRLNIENAKWIYDTIPSGTTIVVY